MAWWRGLVLPVLVLALAGCDRAARAPSLPEQAMAPPPVGAPEPDITRYLEQKRRAVRDVDLRIKRAKRAGDDAALVRLRQEKEEKRKAFHAERDRLTERDDAMLATGATAIGLGGVSLITSGVLGLAYMFSGIFSPGDDNLRDAALGAAAGGLGGLSAGVPLLVLGVERTPRAAPPSAPGPAAAAPSPGATFHVAF
jgi:hypothetical protein